jgi:hypothetical protein
VPRLHRCPFFEPGAASAVSCNKTVLSERVRLDWFHNVRRLVGKFQQGSAPSDLPCDLRKTIGGHQSYSACLGWTSRQKWHESDVCDSSHFPAPNSGNLSFRLALRFSRPNGHVESAYPVPCRCGLSCSVPAKAGRKSWPAVRPARCVVVSKDLSTDVSRPGPACHCPCTHDGSLSLDTLARPFSLTRKRRMRLLPPRLGPYSVPHAGACLQMSEVATATQLQWSQSLPFRS